MRRLNDRELQYKRDKGFCFRCDDKWSVGHRCRKKELSVLLSQEEDENEETDQEWDEAFKDVIEEVRVIPQAEISLNSVMGITSPKTMKLRGSINGNKVVVMIDPGATHNFISLDAVKALGLQLTSSKSFGVSLGAGDALQGEGECKSVVLQLQGITIIEDYLPLALGNSDLILGIQWLEKLGTMTTNWKTQTIKFQIGSDTVTLKGDPSLGRTEISLKQ